jgi:hypothetical protein
VLAGLKQAVFPLASFLDASGLKSPLTEIITVQCPSLVNRGQGFLESRSGKGRCAPLCQHKCAVRVGTGSLGLPMLSPSWGEHAPQCKLLLQKTLSECWKGRSAQSHSALSLCPGCKLRTLSTQDDSLPY